MENILYSGKIPAEITNNSLYSNTYMSFYVFNRESFFFRKVPVLSVFMNCRDRPISGKRFPR